MWKFSTRYSARSLSFSLTLFFSRCRAVFSCCRCLRTTTNNFVENFVSHFSSSSARFLMCVFSFCLLLHLLLHLFFVPSSVFTMLLVIMRFVKFKERRTFGLQHHRLSVLVVMRYAQERWHEGGMANNLPNLRQQQVDLTSTWKKELRIHRAAGNRTLRSLSFATSTISRQLARQYVLLVGANFWVIFIH